MKSIKKLIVVILMSCILLGQQAFAQDTYQALSSGYMQSIMDMIKGIYNGNVTDDKLLEGSLKGMFGTMDPYTVFYTPEEAQAFINSMNGSYSGIGVSISVEDKYIVINKVFRGSPAERAGINSGDRLVEANGNSLVGVGTDVAVGFITGQPGTTVKLGIIKSGSSDKTYIEVKRENIQYNPVTYQIKDNIGYIKLDIFNSNAYQGVREALDSFDKAGVKKIIFDLRDNPGGEVDQAVDIAREFIPKGLITKLDFKAEENTDVEYYSYLEAVKYKVAVLVNSESASASEIIAGAFQDTGAGTLVGTKTFGKAKVQNLYPLLTPQAFQKYQNQLGVKVVNAYDLITKYGISPNQDEIIGWTKITTGMYTTPKGRMIDLKGIEPDKAVEDKRVVNGIDVSAIQKLPLTRKTKLNDSGSDILNAERILKASGYFNGTPDFTFGSDTSAAIAKFQKASGVYAHGGLDFTTQKWLNSKLEELVKKYDTQYATAVEVLNN